MDVPVPDNVKFGTVDQNTGTWQLTDKSLGAGVAVGPQGAQLLTVTPSAVSIKSMPLRQPGAVNMSCPATRL